MMYPLLHKDGNSNQMDVDSTNKHERRFEWRKRFDLIIICCCFNLDLSSFVREPYIVHKSGGWIPYFIPYLFFNIFLGVPLLFVVLSLGQFMKTGRQAIQTLCPLMKGVTFVLLLIGIGYVISAFMMFSYSLHYLYKIFTPSSSMEQWGSCNNYWNTPDCMLLNASLVTNGQNEYNHTSYDDYRRFFRSNSAIEYFFYRFVQGPCDYLNQLSVSVPVISSMIVAILIGYLCICKGIKWLNIIIYVIFAAICFFYVTFAITLAVLPNSGEGLRFMFHSDFSGWLNYSVWKEIILSVLYRYGIGGGVLMSLASYSKFNNKLHYDCVFIGIFNIVITFISTVLAYEFSGKMAIHLNLPFTDVLTGSHMFFVEIPQFASFLYPSATSTAMCVSAFLLTTLIGLAQFIIPLETIFTTFEDEYGKLRKRYYREISRLIICLVLFMICIPLSLNCGSELFSIIDQCMFDGSVVSIVCFFQVISLSWVYGIRKYFNDIELMIGKLPFKMSVFVVIYAVIIPFILFVLFVLSSIQLPPLNGMFITTVGNMTRGFLIMYVPTYMIFAVLTLPRLCKKRCSYLKSSDYPLHVKIAGNINIGTQTVGMEPL